MHFFPLKTVYECSNGRSVDYVKLALSYDILTLRRNFVRKRFQTSHRTPFKEISIAPFDSALSLDYRRFLSTRRGQVYEGRLSLLSRIKDVLRGIIFEKWIPGGNHIVMHSSGLDSRCLSWLIRELYHEHGPDWLGNVVFVCNKWEGESFRDIMAYEGWTTDQYMVSREDDAPNEYYAPSLTNFSDAWIWSDGACSIPVNLFWYLPHEVVQANLIDTNGLQTWSGQWGNTTLDYCSKPNGVKSIVSITKELYKSIFGQRPMYTSGHVRPYGAIDLAKVVCESSIALGDRLRPLFVEYLDSTLLSFVNQSADGDRHRVIAKWIMDKVVDDYKHSWYGVNIHPESRPEYSTTEFQDFWYHWTLASFCEYLIGNDICISCR